MLTLGQLYSQLDEALNINSDDTIFDRRYYYDLIIQTLEVDLRNEYNRLRTFNDFVIQTLPCFEMEIVDASTCCGEILTGCKVLRSKEPLPSVIEFHQSDGLIGIRPNSVLAKSVIRINPERAPYITDTETSKNLIYAFIWNKYLYLYSKNPKHLLIDSVTIRGFFSDPVAASKLGCSSEEDCISDSTEFPIARWMWESLTKPKILQQLLAKQFTPKDEQNNAKDDKTEQQVNNKK